MKKIIWLNLLNHSKTLVDASHPHVELLETFLKTDNVQSLTPETVIYFNVFAEYAQRNNISKDALFSGPIAKLFRTLDEELPQQTQAFDINGHTIIYHYRDPSRRELYNIEIDLDSYSFVKNLGQGTNGTARLYQNKAGLLIVLKTPNPEIPDPGYYEARKRDIEFAQKLYPDDGFYCIIKNFHWVDTIPAFDFQAIIPYIPGENLKLFCSKLTTKADLRETMLAVTGELQRIIHLENVIHGDIHSDNVFVWRDAETRKINVRFMDFEKAYYLHEKATIVTTCSPPHIAPERICLPCVDESFEAIPPDAHPAQDVFSYGYALWDALKKHPLLKELPLIKNYYEECAQKDAAKRPSLGSFIDSLKLEAKNTVSSTGLLIRLGITTATPDYLAVNVDKEEDAAFDKMEKTYSLVIKSNNFANVPATMPSGDLHAAGPNFEPYFAQSKPIIYEDYCSIRTENQTSVKSRATLSL